MFKLVFIVMVSATLIGCFAQERQKVNSEYDARLRILDKECKDNMTEWCQKQYDIIREQRAEAIQEVNARQQSFINSMNHSSKNKTTTHCYSMGNDIYCDSN